jgi:hypothetical protein
MSRALGKIDLLGLGAFGPGGNMNPLYGALIGGGTSGVTAMVLRHTGRRHPEAYGFAVGLAVSGAMFAMKSTRKAAVASVVGTVLATGIALFERVVLGAATAPTPVVAAGEQVLQGLGIPDIRALNGLGIPDVRALNGLGVPMVSERTPPAGAIPGVAGTQLGGPGQPPVNLLGPGSPQSISLLGMGGPAVHGLSSAYGATLLGGGR